MKINMINTYSYNNRAMNTGYKTVSPIAFKANDDETQDTVNFKKNIVAKDLNKSFISKFISLISNFAGFVKSLFKPGNNEKNYTDPELYNQMLQHIL